MKRTSIQIQLKNKKSSKDEKFQKLLFYALIISILLSFFDLGATLSQLTPQTISREGTAIHRYFFQHYGFFIGSIFGSLFIIITRSILYLIFRKIPILNKLLFWFFIFLGLLHISAGCDWLAGY